MKRVTKEGGLAHTGEASQLEPQDLSTESHRSAQAMEGSERELPLLVSETHAAS